MIYLFTYDLRPSFLRNIEPLRQEIMKSPTWWNYLERTWLIATNESANELHKRIAIHLSAYDYWLIVRIRDDYTGWLPKEAWDWIQQLADQGWM